MASKERFVSTTRDKLSELRSVCGSIHILPADLAFNAWLCPVSPFSSAVSRLVRLLLNASNTSKA
jgi:hypothetical protein